MARKFGVAVGEHGARLRKRILVLLPLAVGGNHLRQFAVGLRHLAVLVGVADHGRVGHLLGESLEAFFELIEFRSELHGWSGDNQLSALRLFQSHGAFERADGHRRLVVGRRFGGDALEPKAGAASVASSEPRRLAAKRITS